MAVIEGGVSGSLTGVGAEASNPAHTVALPMSYGSGGYYRIGAVSGTITAALAANAEMFQFRYVTATSRICLVHRVTVSLGANLAATAAGLMSLRLAIARGWTAVGSGGSRVVLTGDNCQLRTSMATSEVNDAGIISTVALTAGTKTLDTSDIGAVAFGIGTGALTVSPNFTLLPPTDLFNSIQEGGHPIVLANQEGFVVRNGANAFPATITPNFACTVYWAEVPSF